MTALLPLLQQNMECSELRTTLLFRVIVASLHSVVEALMEEGNN